MNKNVRAGGFAAAATALVAIATFTDPSIAGKGSLEPVTASYLDHGTAGMLGGELAVNDIDGAADLATGEAVVAEHVSAGMAENVTKIVDAAVPRPRSVTEMVTKLASTQTLDEQQDCLASAIYFEARGESLPGQLAVAEVVLNRVASEKYPDTICEVVEQPWQFSFVNATGRIPEANRASAAWTKAVAISRVATAKLAGEVTEDALWYHADYVSPSWGKRLNRQKKVGLHIFYS